MIVLRLLWNRLSSDLVGEVLGQLLTVTLKSLRKSLCAGKTEPASGERPEVNVAIIISVIVDLLELDCLQDSASYLAVAVLKLSVTVETPITDFAELDQISERPRHCDCQVRVSRLWIRSKGR
jgi:hypothetical protein